MGSSWQIRTFEVSGGAALKTLAFVLVDRSAMLNWHVGLSEFLEQCAPTTVLLTAEA